MPGARVDFDTMINDSPHDLVMPTHRLDRLPSHDHKQTDAAHPGLADINSQPSVGEFVDAVPQPLTVDFSADRGWARRRTQLPSRARTDSSASQPLVSGLCMPASLGSCITRACEDAMSWRRVGLAVGLAVAAAAAVIGGSSASIDPSAAQTAFWPHPPIPHNIPEVRPPVGGWVDRIPAPVREHGPGLARDAGDLLGEAAQEGVTNGAGGPPTYQRCLDQYSRRYYYC